MSAQHTPGRLVVRGGYSIYTTDGTPVADTCLTASIPDNDEANARRLVACWNACEGIDTEYLEGDDSLPHYARRLMAQRDELLAALRMVMACAGDISAAPDGLLEMALDDGDEETRRQANAFLVARAAIAKAEGGAT